MILLQASILITVALVVGGAGEKVNDFPDFVAPSGGILFMNFKPSPVLQIGTGLRINMETLDVTIADGMSIPEAAKRFWNGVALVAGKPPIFPEIKD